MKKAMLIMPKIYSLSSMINSGLKANDIVGFLIDYRDNPKLKRTFLKKFLDFIFYRNDKVKKESKKQQLCNNYILKKYYQINPEYVFIYNEEFLLPKTIKIMKEKSKIVFFLGDNPLNYNPPNAHCLQILFYADLVVFPDSYWKKQLEKIGLKNTVFEIIYDDSNSSYDHNNKITGEENRLNKILFVGRLYRNSWGYKRCLFLEQFSKSGITIYATGLHWDKWLRFFPNIKKCVIKISGKISKKRLENLLLSHKLYPVDATNGISSGIHLRVFECINKGILPILEYTEDIDFVFKKNYIPVIYKYQDAHQLTEKLLNSDKLRIDTLENLRKFLIDNYSSKIVINRILKKI